MIRKKTVTTNLENKKVLFFEMGLTITLAAMLVIFEWATAPPKESLAMTSIDNSDFIPDIIVPITRTKPKPVMPVIPKLNIVEDKAHVQEANFNFDVSTYSTDAYDLSDIWNKKRKVEKPEDIPLYHAQQMPRYHHGGLENFRDYIQSTVKYPEEAIEMGISGKVFVQFVVDKHGNVTQIQIQRGVCPLLDNAVIDALKKSDKWEPGRQMGRPVSVIMNMPISFQLR